MSPTKLTKTADRNLYLDEASKIYIWRERIRGVNHWRSTGETTIGAARQKVKEFRTQATGEKRELERRTFEDAFKLLETIAEGSARRTAVSIKSQLNHLRPWFMGRPADDESPELPAHCAYLDQFERDFPEVWSAYKQAQRDLTPGRKLTHDRRILLQALKATRKKQWVAKDFKNEDLPLLEHSDPIGRIIENSELERLMPYVKESPKLFLQVKLALIMGMRKREILHLRAAEVDLRREVINLKGRRVKTRRGREVPIHVQVLPHLKAWMKEVEGEFLFPAVHPGGYVDLNRPQDDNSTAWERVKNLAKVRCRFHDLRHTAISKMLEAGIPMGTVSMITGASIKVIQGIYAHISKEGLKRAKNYDCGIFVE